MIIRFFVLPSHSQKQYSRACGEIGRRARLRIWCFATCRFESYHAHDWTKEDFSREFSSFLFLQFTVYGNARLDTIEKMAVALGVSVKSLFEPMGDEAVEGFIKIRGKIYQFNCRSELDNLLK